MRIISCGAVVVAVACIAATQGLAQSGRAAAPSASQKVIDDLVVGNRILANEGVLDGLGHISVRSDQRPDRFLLSRDLAPALVTAADLMEYDLDGNPVDARGRGMYQERFIHALIYKARPDVKAVVHGHTPSVLPFTDSTVPLRPMYHMASFLVAGVPVFEIRKVEGSTGMLINNARLGTALAQTLGDKTVALLRGHGFVAVGPDIPEVVSRSIFLDVNARIQAQAIAFGGAITYLSPQDATAPAPTTGALPAPEYPRSWPMWKQRAMGK
jgi:HCOMODA/2-hydroxy-3-carboxy-muconic semialdehyde decarboxylase